MKNVVFFISKHDYYPSRETFSYVAGIAFQRDLGGKPPWKWSARLIAIVYATAMTVLMTSYTANLTANNIKESKDNKFKGFNDERVRRFYVSSLCV